MRAFLVLLAVAAASAAPQMFYSSPLVRPLTYAVKPFEYELKQEGAKVDLKKVEEKKATLQINSPFTYAATPLAYSNIYSNIYSPYRVIAKREAEADPMMVYSQNIMPYAAHHAAAWPMTYSHGINYQAQAFPLTYKANAFPMVYAQPAMYKLKTFSDDRNTEKEYAAKGMYKAETEGSVHIAKREAEPFMMYGNINAAFPYHGMPMTYSNVAYNTMAYAAKPFYNTMTYAASPVMYKKPSEYLYVEQEKPVENQYLDAKVMDNALEKDAPEYAAKGMYRAENEGAVHIAKREADPFMVYRSNINTAFPYTGYNTLGYTNMAYNGMTYAASPLAYRSAYNWPLVY